MTWLMLAVAAYLVVVLASTLFFLWIVRRQPPAWVGDDPYDGDDLADIDGGRYQDDGVFREAPAASGVWGVGQW